MQRANDTKLAYEYGKIQGEKISSCGIHWWFEPCVDLNMSSLSPVINIRSLSDDPDIAIPLAKAIIKGVQDSGIAATAKHFPATDDKECVDPHLAPVNNKISKEKWDSTNGKMYSELFKDGVMSVMMGHQNLVCYQTEKVNGRYPPSTMSKEIATGLLKEKLGFEGVIVTDALVMGGFTGADGINNQVKSFEAGNDVMLWADLKYMDLLEEKILNGEISMSRLDDAVTRILVLKEKIVCSFGSPYHYEYYCETPTTYINAYTNTPTMHDTFVRAITGQIEFKGKSPVKLV